jgi:hypothetical protein
LESVDVINTDAYKNRPRIEWRSRVLSNTSGANFCQLVSDMIRPSALTDGIARNYVTNVLQIGRMNAAPPDYEEWNER